MYPYKLISCLFFSADGIRNELFHLGKLHIKLLFVRHCLVCTAPAHSKVRAWLFCLQRRFLNYLHESALCPLMLYFIYNKFHLLSRNGIFHNYSVAIICNGYSLVWEVYSFYGSCSSKSFFHVILISLYTLLFLCMPDCKCLASHIKKNEDYICSPHYLKTIISLL